jgi:hypothetical protein
MKESKSSRSYELNDDKAIDDYVSCKAYNDNCKGCLRELERISLLSDAHDHLHGDFNSFEANQIKYNKEMSDKVDDLVNHKAKSNESFEAIQKS